jgi:aquaporin Z
LNKSYGTPNISARRALPWHRPHRKPGCIVEPFVNLVLMEVAVGKKIFAEFFGTFWLVFGGCGSAVLAAAFPQLGIGFAGVALAFGLTVLTMAYAVGHISGGHFNPAVTLGLFAGGRFPARDVVPYIVAQVIGGVAAGAVLYIIASGKAGFDATAGFASNGYGAHSPGGYSLAACMVAELVLTAFFLLVIHGVTDKRAPAGFAPLAIGMALTLIHLISIPVTNTSVNPARSTAVAIFQGTWALEQLWMFWLVPVVGGVLGGLVYRYLLTDEHPAILTAPPPGQLPASGI